MEYEEAKRVLEAARREYAVELANGANEEDALSDAIEAYTASNSDALALIWATGNVSEAFDAVYEDIECAICREW